MHKGKSEGQGLLGNRVRPENRRSPRTWQGTLMMTSEIYVITNIVNRRLITRLNRVTLRHDPLQLFVKAPEYFFYFFFYFIKGKCIRPRQAARLPVDLIFGSDAEL